MQIVITEIALPQIFFVCVFSETYSRGLKCDGVGLVVQFICSTVVWRTTQHAH